MRWISRAFAINASFQSLREGADDFVEVEHAVRFERTKNGAEELLELGDVMRRLVKEDRVIDAGLQPGLVEVRNPVVDAIRETSFAPLFLRDVDRDW